MYMLNDSDIERTYFEAYRFARVKQPIKFDNDYFSRNDAPLPKEELDILEELVEWDEICMGENWIRVKNRKIEHLVNFKFYHNSGNNN